MAAQVYTNVATFLSILKHIYLKFGVVADNNPEFILKINLKK